MVCGDLKYDSKRAFAVDGVVNAAYDVIGQSILLLRNAWPKTLQVLWVFRNEGLILAARFGLSAFSQWQRLRLPIYGLQVQPALEEALDLPLSKAIF
nr:putative DUF21 domain-containing protein At3g13070, chloroplastic [Ziziphus jujuba var. spinosa]